MATTNGIEPEAGIKEQLYGMWTNSVARKDRIHEMGIRKALDLPEDMGDVNAPKTVTTKTGMGWQEIAAMGALGLGGLYLYNDQQTTQQPPAPPPAAVASDSVPLEDREYQIIFRDESGNIVQVPRWPGATPPAEPAAK